MRRESFGPDDIVVPPRLRTRLDDATVVALMDSIQRIGLQTPVTVRWKDEDVVLVAGRHRLEALRRLAVPLVEFNVIDGDERDARLWEIAENLHRADLTVQERAEHIAEWVRLTAQGLELKLAQVGPVSERGRIEGRGNKGGINAATRDLGITRQEAQRAVKIASLAPEAKEAARVAQVDDNQAVLLAAAVHDTPEAQVAHIELEARRRQEAAISREEERRRLREVEEAHKLNQQQDKAIRLTVEQEFAEWLMRHVAPSETDTLISWLQVVKNPGVIAALRRQAA